MPESIGTTTSSAPAPTPSSTPPGGTATPATPATSAPSPVSPTSVNEFRFPSTPDTPQWAWGKSPGEVLNVARGYEEAFNRSGGPPARPEPPRAPDVFNVRDDDIVTGQQLKQYLDQAQRQVLAPQFQQSTEMAASAIYGFAQSKYADEFKRYGPEIQQELQRVPKQMWTVDNMKTIVDIVAGRHREDYARERAQELIAQMEPTIRPMGGGSEPVPTPEQKNHSLESDKIPADWKARAKQAGITESTVREFCASNDMSPEQFFQMFEKSPLQPIVAEVPSGR